MKFCKEGTISVIIGVHSPIHSIMVTIAWVKLYKKLPKFWELCCIFLHDIGHIGLDYLTYKDQKDLHTLLGAKIAGKLFGRKGYELLIDHDKNKNNYLYKPDKYSWYISPKWVSYVNAIVEPKIKAGMGIRESISKWRSQVAKSIENGEYKNSHDMFLERLQSTETPDVKVKEKDK